MLLALLVSAAFGMPARAETTVLALGDSLVAGYGLPEGQSFTDRLQAALRAEGHDVRVIDGGVSGDTTAGGLARLDWMLAEEPDAVIVVLGGNDTLRGLEPEQTHANLDAILTRLEEEGVAVLLAGMRAPPNMGSEYTEEFDAVYPRLAREHAVVFYPFFLDGVAARPELNQSDGIHPNARGVEVIVERLLPHVKELLNASG